MINKDLQSFSEILKSREPQKKPTAYSWQELALRVIKELNIPNFKRSAVFKICKVKPKNFVEQAMNDTKELCDAGEKWKYFFKIINSK